MQDSLKHDQPPIFWTTYPLKKLTDSPLSLINFANQICIRVGIKFTRKNQAGNRSSSNLRRAFKVTGADSGSSACRNASLIMVW